MIYPTGADIGREVIYMGYMGYQYFGARSELGIIASLDEGIIYVLYEGATDERAAAPRDLEWLVP